MICKTLFYHSLLLFKALPKTKINETEIKWNSAKSKFYSLLPIEFSRANAIEKGILVKVTERTVDNWLKKLEGGGYLEKIKHGKYRKPS